MKRLAILLFAAGILLFAEESHAATRTWDGGGADNNWNTAANWSSDSIPGASDTAQFDNTSVKNCTINISVDVRGIDILSTYTGTIAQSAGLTMTVGTSDFSQAGGTFAGGNSTIDCNDRFTLSGGTLSSTSGTLFVDGNFTMTGGTFNHNSGTVTLDGGSATANIGSTILNNLTIAKGGNDLTVTGTLDVNGNLTVTSVGNINAGTITVAGNLTSNDTNLGGTATLRLDGTGTQTISAGANGEYPAIDVNKSAGTAVLGSDVRCDITLTITNGTFSQGASFNLTVTGATTIAAAGTFLNTGSGDLTLGGNVTNSGTVNFDAGGTGSSTDTILLRSTAAANRTWSGSGTFSFIDVDVQRQTSGSPPGIITAISSTDSGSNVNWVFGSATPVLYLKMDDGSGSTATDSSGNGFNGTLLGGTTWSTTHAPLLVANPYSNSFDGIDDSIQVANATLLNPGLAFTISAWVYPDATGSGIILAKWNTTGNLRQYSLDLTGNKLRLQVSTNGQAATVRSVTSTGSISTGIWTHVAGVYAGGDMNVYIDGTKTSASFGVASAFSGTTSLRLGRDEQGTFYNGLIDEVQLYNIALTDAQIAALAQRDTTPPAKPINLTLVANSDSTAITGTVTAPSDSDVSELIWRYNAVDGNTTPSFPSTSTSGSPFGDGLTTGVTPSSTHTKVASSLTQLKTYGVAVWARDAAGNVSTSAVLASLYLAPPTPRLVITAAGGVSSSEAGSSLALTITARDANNNIISSYAGPYTLTWTPTGGSALTLVNSSSSFSGGLTTASVSIGGSDAGVGNFQAVDNSSNNLTTGTLPFTWYPASFSMAADASTPVAGRAFTLKVTAKDRNGSTVTRYAGTAVLTLNYKDPTTGTKGLSKSSLLPAEFASGIASTSLTYQDAGKVEIAAKDTTTVSGVTIAGTSEVLTFSPVSFKVTVDSLPKRLTKAYVNQPFDVKVQALADDKATLTPNYNGTVNLTGSGATMEGHTYTFVPGADKGEHTLSQVTASSSGTLTLTATAGSVTGSSDPLGIRSASLIINPATGLPGTELTTSTFILESETNAVVSEDDSTRFQIILQDPSEGSAAASAAAAAPMTVSSGTASFSATKPDSGEVVVTATVLDFSMPVVSATLKWPARGGKSGAGFNILQFEQPPGSRQRQIPPVAPQQPPSNEEEGSSSP